jgi:3-dehydroquinate synthase
MISVPVALGERSYAIHIGQGLIAKAGELLTPFLVSARTVPVITDTTVAALHYGALRASLEAAGLTPQPIVLPPGEHTKSFAYLEELIGKLLTLGVERTSLIVAFGGGVIGDLTGFGAGILKRGIDFAQVPTTLLAQVDSSVGGKTAIDTKEGKNLVGVFHQPKVVIADTAVLKTLRRRELLGGYAEVAKYGLIGDAAFFAWLEEHADAALRGDASGIDHAVGHSCAMKAAIVGRDERESGERALLNLGHTFAHALEAAIGYSDRMSHGEGVAIGCVLAFKLSARLGLVDEDTVTRVERHFAAVGLPTRLAQIPGPRPTPEEILVPMRHDKKAAGGRMTFILVRDIGRAFISRDVPEDAVRATLAEA